MASDAAYAFGPFRLDLEAGALRREGDEVPLTPRAFSLLRYLVERPGKLLSREELLEAVWPAAYVGDEALKVRIRELRRALEDAAGTPRFIATIHRRGYRFVGEVRTVPPGRASATAAAASAAEMPPLPVGRQRELARLGEALGRAVTGERQAVFVSGEPGIGKTTVIEAFLARLAGDELCVARGQCLELHGAGESYLPLFDALGRMARGPWAARLVSVLRRLAPTWLAQMPWLLDAAERAALVREASGATRERMLRELAEGLEALAAETPLVFVLEDLHWSDASTLDLLSYVARRRESARLLLVATYRPEEVAGGGHALALLPHDLAARGWAVELPLGLLTEAEVGEYLAERLGGAAPAGLARLLYRRTEGSPLFLVNALEDLLGRGILRRDGSLWRLASDPAQVELGVPAGLRALLAQQLERLDLQERRLLEAASIAGAEFAPEAVAAALSADAEEIDERCASLSRRRRFLRGGAGEHAGSYAFLHASYRDAVYEGVAPGRRARLHARLAEQAERAYGAHTGEHAAELAVHFERAGEPARALPYLLQAARNAARRFASHEILIHARRALALLGDSGGEPDRQTELELQVLRGTALMSTRGYGDVEVERAFARARELCRDSGEEPELFPILAGLFGYHLIRAELATAWELAEELLRRAAGRPHLLVEAHYTAGVTLLNRGDFRAAHDHLAAGAGGGRVGDFDPAGFGRDAAAACASFDAWALWSLGFPDRAVERAAEAIARARAVDHPHSLAFALFFTAFVRHFRREPGAARTAAEELVALSRAEAFAQWLAFGTILRGWAQVEDGRPEEGLEEIRAGLAEYRATGAAISVPHFLGLLGEALARCGRAGEAREAIEEGLALAIATGGRYYEAELLRLRGELALAEAPPDGAARRRAVRSFRQSLDVARRQGARGFELRAAASWAGLQPRSAAARRALQTVYGAFTERPATPDLRHAAALLAREDGSVGEP